MKTVSRIFIAATACLAAVALLSCAGLRQPPDPAKVQMKIAAAREKEIALVRETVSEPARAERFVELLGERDRLVEKHAKHVIEHREKMAVLAADYDAEREEFEALLTEFNRQRALAQKETIDLVVAMKATTTADEWKAISRFQLKRLQPRELIYGAAAQGN